MTLDDPVMNEEIFGPVLPVITYKTLDEAFAIADRLSKPFDFVRVDLYLTPHGVRFGELTFTPAAALDNKRLPETDLRFGRRMEETL